MLHQFAANSFSSIKIYSCINELLEKISSPIEVTEGGITGMANDEHLPKAKLPIEVTEGGIVICANDEQSKKAHFPIEVTEEGISNVICVNDEHL